MLATPGLVTERRVERKHNVRRSQQQKVKKARTIMPAQQCRIRHVNARSAPRRGSKHANQEIEATEHSAGFGRWVSPSGSDMLLGDSQSLDPILQNISIYKRYIGDHCFQLKRLIPLTECWLASCDVLQSLSELISEPDFTDCLPT